MKFQVPIEKDLTLFTDTYFDEKFEKYKKDC